MSNKPKKGSATRQLAGHQRVADLHAIRSNVDSNQRRLGLVRFIRTWIDVKRLQHEPALEELAWVEYRYESPLERTERFTRDYIDAYRAAYAKALPGEDAAKRRPVDPMYVCNPPDVMNALWEARARADAMGVPYPIYLEAVIAGHFENDHWKRPPRPNQLYGKLAAPRVRGRPSMREIAARLCGPDWDARFFADRYVGDPIQEAAIALMRADVLGTADPAARLAHYLVERRAITLDRATSAFGQELADAAIAIGGHLPPAPPQSDGKGPHEPSCFGFPAIWEDSICLQCPVNEACVDLALGARDELIRVTGSDDPRGHRKRQLDALRQRLHREKKRIGPRKGGTNAGEQVAGGAS